MAKERIYIVASGPSLKGFDFSQLDDEVCLAVNDSLVYLKRVAGVVAIDTEFYDRYYKYLKLSRFPMYAVRKYDPSDIKKELGVIEYPNTGVSGVEMGEGIRHGFNSGYTAIGVAIKMGYKDIRVLGMDLTNTGHFHPLKPTLKDFDFSYVIKHLEKLKKQLPKGVKITFYGKTNANMFENKPLSECLK